MMTALNRIDNTLRKIYKKILMELD